MATIDIAIAVIGLVIASLTFYLGRMTSANRAGREIGVMSQGIASIKESIDRLDTRVCNDMKRLEGRIDEQSNQLIAIGRDTTKALESATSAHKRIDEMRH